MHRQGKVPLLGKFNRCKQLPLNLRLVRFVKKVDPSIYTALRCVYA